MAAKRHHYVPQFYLRYFVPKGGNTLWVYDKEGGGARPQQPKDTAVIRGFYSIKTATGELDDMEQEFSCVEAIAKRVLDRWQEDRAIPSPREIAEIAYFLALLHTRVPRAAGVTREIGLAILLAELEQLRKDPEQARKSWEEFVGDTDKTGLPLEDFLEFLENPLANFKIEINEKVGLGIAMRTTKMIARHLLSMNWRLCVAPDPLFFATCDAPVNVFVPHGAQAQFGGGLALKNVEVVFPVSPNVCLLLDRKHTQKRCRVKENFVKEINRRVAYMAERYIFSPIDARFVSQLVVEACRTRQMPKMDRELLMRLYRARRIQIGPRADSA